MTFSSFEDSHNKRLIADAADDDRAANLRLNLAQFSSETFKKVGDHLNLLGHLVGEIRDDGKSPFGRRNDEVLGMSILIRIGSQLVSASSNLIDQRQAYAGAALLRQVVEIEYLAWAFEKHDRDAERWFQSDPETRAKFFRSKKLIAAAKGVFRGKDYGDHCEFGGHPVPAAAATLLDQDNFGNHQVLLLDLLHHTESIWDSFEGWAKNNEEYTSKFRPDSLEMSKRFQEWKDFDPLLSLHRPPLRQSPDST